MASTTKTHPITTRIQEIHTPSVHEEKNPGEFVIPMHAASSPTPKNSTPHPAPNSLQIFHHALGVPPPKPAPKKRRFLIFTSKPKPPAPGQQPPLLTHKNHGIYPHVLSAEKWARRRYHACSAVVTLAMFLQIIVGAAVTALGAGSASHILITVFGAANTALASLLAVLKAQGLPNRVRQDWNEWRTLREWIEEREREIEGVLSRGLREGELAAVKEEDVWKIVKDVEERYQATRLTLEANRPDSYTRVPVGRVTR